MTENTKRRLPVGIQSFEEIRTKEYLYVDKTDIIWHLANEGNKFNYLSRPRRFGKSVLIDTLQAYFEGKKELFHGLKIMDMEKEWVKHPVVRLDMSRGGATAAEVKAYLDLVFRDYESRYGIEVVATDSLSNRFDTIIKTAYKKTGQQVAILIDEYDSPLQHSWKTPYHEECTAVYRSVFAILKADDQYERFVFITGITKFTQISLFSVLNNLSNISFDAPYAALCGITKQELIDNFMPEIKSMGEANGWSVEETIEQLKGHYDGYHFSIDNMVDIFNPFSLINALSTSKLRNYWASSGSTSLLPKFVDDMEIRLNDLDNSALLGVTIEASDVTGGGAELFLYQSGYLTIKGYINGTYLLCLPNQDVPYSNKKLASMDMEERYRLVMSTIFNSIGCRVEVERMISTGRIDMVVATNSYIYVIELKLTKNGGIAAGEKQIKDNRYIEPFKADKRKVIALAIELDDLGKGLKDWKQVEE